MPSPLTEPEPPRIEPARGPRPSKTRLKKAMHELQELGAALAALPDERIEELALSETLHAALGELRRTRSHEGRRRQLQYVGKLMRGVDPEPIRAAVAAQRITPAREALALHRAEAWRARLAADDGALAAWGAEFPGSDLQQLRSLIRAARRDTAAVPEQRKGRAWRELFQFIKRAQRDSPEEE